MKKQTKTAAELISTLNKHYHAAVDNLHALEIAGDTDNDDELVAFLKHGKLLEDAFDKTMDELTAVGATVKFDYVKGEYYIA